MRPHSYVIPLAYETIKIASAFIRDTPNSSVFQLIESKAEVPNQEVPED
jgi:hypothetical protein